MGKIYTSQEFINILRHIATLPTVYYSGGNGWSTWNGSRWQFDCVCSVKSVLWNWKEDKNAPHGGANYKSNGVPDFTCNGGLDYCTDVSKDFHNITPGEYLCMKDTQYNHVGIYLGNGEVFEVTTAWGVDGATISGIDGQGYRYRGSEGSLRWTYHGKLQWIDYEEKPMKHKVGEVVEINGVYVSSTSTEKLTPAVTKGTITKIVEGARNPYLLDDGKIGWVNDDCIVEPTPTDYEKLYKEEVEKNEYLTIVNNNLIALNDSLKEKIDKAIKDLS